MAKTWPVVAPFPLTNRLDPAEFVRGVYDNTLTGDNQYGIGDIVTTRSGKVVRSVEASTAANVEKLAIAGQPWSMPKALPYFYDRGVPLNRIRPEDEWVMTLAGVYATTILAHVVENDSLDVLFDASADAKALTIRSATNSPTVKVLRLFQGEAGDTNVRVVVNFLPGKVL